MNTIPELTATMQGSFVKITHSDPAARPQSGGAVVRGRITTFSVKSRKRLLDLTAQLDRQAVAEARPLFITLTYGQLFPSPIEASAHLEAFKKRIARAFPSAAAIWRKEPQTRGAPHFHLALCNVGFIKHEILRWLWGDVIGKQYWDWKTPNYTAPDGSVSKHCSPPRVDVQKVKSTRQLFGYVSKVLAYVSKSEPNDDESAMPVPFAEDSSSSADEMALLQREALAYFIYVPYLSALFFVMLRRYLHARYTGRHWGIFQRDFLPFAPVVTFKLQPNMKLFFTFRRYMAKRWKSANKFGRYNGATIYAWDNAHCWSELFYRLLQDAGITDFECIVA